MMTNKPSFKTPVTSIADGFVHVTIDNETLRFPEKIFSELPNIGEEIYVTIQTQERAEDHHKDLSKTILNKIFGKKT